MKPLAYVAGPYTNPDPVLNVRRACEVGDRLDRLGFAVIVPHLSMLWHLASPQGIETWYRRDLDVLTHCDLIVRFPGDSTGADAEVRHAIANGIDHLRDSVSDETFIAYVTSWHERRDIAEMADRDHSDQHEGSGR